MKSLIDYLNEHKSCAEIFIIIKPGFLRLSQCILERFANSGWKIKQSKAKRLLLSEAKQLYKIHKKEDWYKPLCEYMASDTVEAFILYNDMMPLSQEAIDNAGEIKEAIRKEYAESDMRNVLHSSDSVEHMMEEKKIFFNNIL